MILNTVLYSTVQNSTVLQSHPDFPPRYPLPVGALAGRLRVLPAAVHNKRVERRVAGQPDLLQWAELHEDSL